MEFCSPLHGKFAPPPSTASSWINIGVSQHWTVMTKRLTCRQYACVSEAHLIPEWLIMMLTLLVSCRTMSMSLCTLGKKFSIQNQIIKKICYNMVWEMTGWDIHIFSSKWCLQVLSHKQVSENEAYCSIAPLIGWFFSGPHSSGAPSFLRPMHV